MSNLIQNLLTSLNGGAMMVDWNIPVFELIAPLPYPQNLYLLLTKLKLEEMTPAIVVVVKNVFGKFTFLLNRYTRATCPVK